MSSYIPDNNVYPAEAANCPDFLKRYLWFLKNNQGKRPLTLSEATLLLQEFCQYVHYKHVIRESPPTADAHKDMGISNMELTELGRLQQTDIEEYVSFLDNKAQNSEKTIYKKLSILRTFFAYLVKMQSETGVAFVSGNPVPGMTRPSSEGAVHLILTVNQMQRIIDAVPDETRLRDRAILLLLTTTGIQVSELSFIEIENIIDTGWLCVNNKNGGRFIWLTPACHKAVREYLIFADQQEGKRRYLFQSHRSKDQPLTTKAIRNIISRAAENAQISCAAEVTPKVLRDTVAKILYETAALHEQASVSHYLGYRIHSHRQAPPASTRRFSEDVTMQNVVSRSALVSLGTVPMMEEAHR